MAFGKCWCDKAGATRRYPGRIRSYVGLCCSIQGYNLQPGILCGSSGRPLDIRSAPTLSTFKNMLKTSFISIIIITIQQIRC